MLRIFTYPLYSKCLMSSLGLIVYNRSQKYGNYLQQYKHLKSYLFFSPKLKQYLQELREGRVVGFQGIPEPELGKLSGSPRQRLSFLGGHMIPCPWSNQLWVKDLSHESHLSHLTIIVGTYYMRKGLGKAYKLSIQSTNFSMQHSGKIPIVSWQTSGKWLYSPQIK